ncbi:MAG: DUF1361 domain-containing protein [Chloroflexi bacterium]|nr:DUF1361 domain-containing protein [Chloroflexota bacterium]
MKKMYERVHPYRFRMTVLALLCGATLLSVALFRVRTMLSNSIDYVFLVGNIFLAWIPLGLAYTASVFAWKRRFLLLAVPLMFILWMLFFPNAPYILTDLQHLGRPREDVPLWFDMLMLIWFSWTGLLLGVVSMFLMQDIVRRQFGRIAGWFFVLASGTLCSLGVYIGRFLRWNSWDMFFNPFERLQDFMYYASHPGPRAIIFISVFSAFFLFFYITLYAFGLLLQEQAPPIPQEIS